MLHVVHLTVHDKSIVYLLCTGNFFEGGGGGGGRYLQLAQIDPPFDCVYNSIIIICRFEGGGGGGGKIPPM